MKVHSKWFKVRIHKT